MKQFGGGDVNGLLCLGLRRASLEEQSDIADWRILEFGCFLVASGFVLSQVLGKLALFKNITRIW